MTLHSYLKQFKNIAWYASAGRDAFSMVCLSSKSLRDYGISKEEAPDCFIFTDYETYANHAENHKFFLDLDKEEDEVELHVSNQAFSLTAYNVKELDKLALSFDQDLVAFDKDRYYGRVFTMDVLLEHPNSEKTIVKLIYVITENTAFALEFLLKRNIQVKYVIHSRYGHGYGGGRSNGQFMCNILQDLGTKYFASDMNNRYDLDIADKYLTETQKNTIPVLEEMDNFSTKYGWRGYGDTIFYEVVDFKSVETWNDENRRFFVKHKGGKIC